MAVEELLLGRLFEPDLVLGVGGQVVQGGDVEAELARLGELAEARAERDQLLATVVGGLERERSVTIIEGLSNML